MPETTEKKKITIPTIHNTPLLISKSGFDDMLLKARCEAEVKAFADNDDEFLSLFPAPNVIGNTAVLGVSGTISLRASWWQLFFGGTSIDVLTKHLKVLVADDSIRRIVLDVDSPGGYVDGVDVFAQAVFDAREKKEIVAMVNPMCASAAYWIASAAHEIYITSGTSITGSIGVIISHVDYSKMLEGDGVKVTEITAGKYKNIASSHKPLSKEGKEELQAQADYIYSLFVNDVAKHRNKTVDEALAMADGRIFLGRQAVDIGLADGFKTMSDLLEDNDLPDKEKTPVVSLAYLKENNPDLLASIKEEAYKDGFEKGKAEGNEAGIKAERERVSKVSSLSRKGYENIITKAITEGNTPEQAAMALWKESENRGSTANLENMKADSTQAKTEKTEDEQPSRLAGLRAGAGIRKE